MNRRILLIDDTAVLAKSIADLLEMEGFTVQVCHTGSQALLFLRDNLVDLVVSDLRMPEMDGLELTKRIRNTERLKNIPVIIITADTNKENEKLSKDAGANLLLHKPFDEEYFLECIRQILTR